MFNDRGEIAVVDPGDMRYLIYLALRCRSARRTWRRMRKLENVPATIVTLHEGAWLEAHNSFQTAKTMARVSYVDPSKTAPDKVKVSKSTEQPEDLFADLAGHFRAPGMPVRKPSYRERLQSLVAGVVGAPTHDALVCLHRDIRAECMCDNRKPTTEEKQLLSDIYHYVKQIEALCPGIQPADLSWGPNNPRFLHPQGETS